MMTIKQKNILILIVGVSLFGVVFLWGSNQKKNNALVVTRHIEKPGEITIFWAEWSPADILQSLANDFTEETGIKVNIVQEPWGTWQQKFFDEMNRKGKTYDMVIGDSQWLGRGTTEGHYIELTKWIKENEVDKSMTSASITGYAEFPKGSGHFWAVPAEGDAMGFSYRKDLFEDPAEKMAFKEQYGYALEIPKTWLQLRDIAAFFYRPEEDFYGVLSWVTPDYDGITMGVQSVVWAWGGHLGNQHNYQVQGILNGSESIAGLEFYKELNNYNNPLWRYYYLDKQLNSNTPMMKGKVAMAMGYFAATSELLDSRKNPYAHDIGFFANPRGPKSRVCSLGGQGISIISYTQKKDLCFLFLEWFVRQETQRKWADIGGLSCNKVVLASDRFLNASPINRPFKESIEMAKDFWAVPEYPQLLSLSQQYWDEYINTDARNAKETMDSLAYEWEKIFEKYGYYKE